MTDYFAIFLFLVMSSNKITFQKDYLFRLYIAIENIANIGHMFCCCQAYWGCETIQKFLRKAKRFCCYCQFADWYNFHSLHQIKKDPTRLQALYYEVLDDINILKLYTDVNQNVLDFDFFWSAQLYYKFKWKREIKSMERFLFLFVDKQRNYWSCQFYLLY